MTVRAADTGRPLAGAQVVAPSLGAGAVTDSTGVYWFRASGVTAGSRVRLAARLHGYASASREVRVAGDTVRADFSLAPRGDDPRGHRSEFVRLAEVAAELGAGEREETEGEGEGG